MGTTKRACLLLCLIGCGSGGAPALAAEPQVEAVHSREKPDSHEKRPHAEAGSAGPYEGRITGDAPIDDFRIRLGLGKPSFTDLEYFDVLYGGSAVMPSFGIDMYFLKTDFLSLGGTFQFSFYTQSGHEVKYPKVDSPQPSELKKVAGKLNLTLVPYRFLFAAELRPFGRSSWASFLNMDLWFGYEELYYQEVRTVEQTVQASSPTSTASTSPVTSFASPRPRKRKLGLAATQADERLLINSGWNAHSVFGGALNIRINRLDERSVRSMRQSLGISSVYISPFMEVTRPLGSRLINGQKAGKVSFARQTYGLAFTFEGLMQ